MKHFKIIVFSLAFIILAYLILWQTFFSQPKQAIGLEKDPLTVSTSRNDDDDNKVRSLQKNNGEVKDNFAVDLEFTALEEVVLEHYKERVDRVWLALDSNNIGKAQDIAMSRWPEYTKVKKQLLKELSADVTLEALLATEIVDKIIESREQFWKEGGNLSVSSWKAGYKALILAEVAYENFPQDHKVVNQLVETMQSVWPIWSTVTNENDQVEKTDFRKKITEIRCKQFEQIKTEIADGREISYNDFLCGADALFLTQAAPPENKYNIDTLNYLQTMCQRKNWNDFQRVLTYVETVIEKDGYGYGMVVLDPGDPTIESSKEEPRYLRRLPSFGGPKDRKATVIELR